MAVKAPTPPTPPTPPVPPAMDGSSGGISEQKLPEFGTTVHVPGDKEKQAKTSKHGQQEKPVRQEKQEKQPQEQDRQESRQSSQAGDDGETSLGQGQDTETQTQLQAFPPDMQEEHQGFSFGVWAAVLLALAAAAVIGWKLAVKEKRQKTPAAAVRDDFELPAEWREPAGKVPAAGAKPQKQTRQALAGEEKNKGRHFEIRI